MVNPILGLVRHGLQRWLRSQCESVDHLHLELEGMPEGLLQGRLEAACLQARGIVWGALRFRQAIITCRHLHLNLDRLRPGQPIPLVGPLVVRLELWCSAADLQHMVLGEGEGEIPMGVALLAHFRGLAPGDCRGWRLEMTGAGLRLLPPAHQTQIPPLLLQLRAVDHGITVHGEEAPDRPATIPLDPAIRIHDLKITPHPQHLRLRGEAWVTP